MLIKQFKIVFHSVHSVFVVLFAVRLSDFVVFLSLTATHLVLSVAPSFRFHQGEQFIIFSQNVKQQNIHNAFFFFFLNSTCTLCNGVSAGHTSQKPRGVKTERGEGEKE